MPSEAATRPLYEFVAGWFPSRGRLLDLGCGAGALLEIAETSGMDALGIDADEDNVAHVRARGLDVQRGDALHPALDPNDKFDVITIVHLVEHFDGGDAQALVDQAAARLHPGGRLVLVTPNMLDPQVAAVIFWLDATHVRPYSADDLSAMVEQAGLSVIHVSTELLVNLGRRRALLRPFGRLRHGREYDRPNLVVVAEAPAHP